MQLQSQQLDSYGEQQRLNLLLEMNFKRVFKELAEIREQIAALQAKNSSGATRQAPVMAEEQDFAAQKITPKPVQQPVTFARQETTATSRTGAYTPDDVSLEKFFYAGSKRG